MHMELVVTKHVQREEYFVLLYIFVLSVGK